MLMLVRYSRKGSAVSLGFSFFRFSSIALVRTTLSVGLLKGISCVVLVLRCEVVGGRARVKVSGFGIAIAPYFPVGLKDDGFAYNESGW